MKKLVTIILAVLMLAMGVNAAFERVKTYSDDFSDVTENNWFYENVKTAYELGFVNGKSEGKFDPNGNVTVAEGITMASRLHALYNGTEVKKSDASAKEYRLDFDDPKILSAEKSENPLTITFGRATGEIVDGMLVVKPDAPNQSGVYDPQIKFAGFELDSSDYDKISFRMKVDELEDANKRMNAVEFFFQTSVEWAVSTDRQVNIAFPKNQDYSEWFEAEADLSKHKKWNDIITGFRFDPSNNNGIYYIDYIVFSGSENSSNEKWYDMYVDYAIENGIIEKTLFKKSDYNRNVTREEMCLLIAKAIPEEYFVPVNDVRGIPDVDRDSENADVYLTLYNAGILLGDENGKFLPDDDIKRSEIAAIINRVALPESRVKGNTGFDWTTDEYGCEIEFENGENISNIDFYKAEYTKIENGVLVMKSQFMGEAANPQYDPQISVKNVFINADDYTKLRVRMKAEFIGEVQNQLNKQFDFYFGTEEDPVFSQAKSIHQYLDDAGYVDAFGWHVIEIDLTANRNWKGNITGFRFDPATANGIFTIDYIRFVGADPLFNATHEDLLAKGYEATYLIQDNGFENGFYVDHFEQKMVDREQRIWQYNDTDAKPMWDIGPWWNGYDLWENRVTEEGKYVLTDDKGINTIVYNPDEKSISMRVNATKIYNGEPHDPEKYSWWPHLLLDQGFKRFPVDKKKNTINVDRTYLELDMRITDFKDTINKEGRNACTFLAYFYLLSEKNPSTFIYYGLHLFTGTSPNYATVPGWAPDSAGNRYMYGIRQTDIYGSIENSFSPAPGVVDVGEEWKHIRVDITEHLDTCIEWANRDKAFGVEVSRKDMYFSGCNIGFEIHGNYDCTVEIKNVNIVSYNKAD